MQKPDRQEKMLIKRPKKVKTDRQSTSPMIKTVTVSTAIPHSVEATQLNSLPGYSSSPVTYSVTPTKTVRESLFEKHQTPPKSSQADRANIFEQFSVPSSGGSVTMTPQGFLQQSALTGNTVRFVNTPQGKQMVVVSTSQPGMQPQNVVLLQSVQQGFPQTFVVGNNLVSLQGTPLNVATLRTAAQPNIINLQGARLASTPQVISPRLTAARIVTPGNMQQQPYVQRLVSANSVNVSLPGVQGLAIPQINTIQNITNIQQINTSQQIRMQQAPLIQTSLGQTISVQNLTPQNQPTQRKSNAQTIASLIANSKGMKERASPTTTVSSQMITQVSNIPSTVNLANIMKAQIPTTSTTGKVKVNPAVAKLVASHIQAASQQGLKQQQQGTAEKINIPQNKVPSIISLTSGSNLSPNPTVVKLVSASSITAASLSNSAQPGSRSQTIKTTVPTGAGTSRGDGSVATINIKGLPPGISLPVSLVNSLVSGSIGNISKANLSILKAAAQPASMNVKVSSTNTIVNANTVPSSTSSGASVSQSPVSIVSQKQPSSPSIVRPQLTTPQGSPTLQAWSNPNLVIRTRRAAQQLKTGSPGAAPALGDSPAIQLPTPTATNHINNNTTVVSNMPAAASVHAVKQDGGVTIVAKKVDKATPAGANSVQTNGTTELMETE